MDVLKQLTREQLESEVTRLRLAVEATCDAVWDWDLKTDRIVWNDSLQQAYGYVAEAIEPTCDWRFAQIHTQDRGRVTHSIRSAIDGKGTTWSAEYRFRCHDGS